MQSPYQETQQKRIISFLSTPSSYSLHAETVDTAETHGALVFMAGKEVYKIKKAVRFPYMDFSTLELRKKACTREIEINKQAAPEIYIDTVPITQDANGCLYINGPGTPVEWAVHMHRFDEAHVLYSLIKNNQITDDLIKRLGAVIADSHEHASVDWTCDGLKKISDIVEQLSSAFEEMQSFLPKDMIKDFTKKAYKILSDVKQCLNRRAEKGYIRRCHGDLHLKNIVEIQGKPVLFDAIEFDENIATIDVLYDLAFLLMDLLQAGEKRTANLLFNRYLYSAKTTDGLHGLQALPLFLSCRAAIRAMVKVQQAQQHPEDGSVPFLKEADNYLKSAVSYLTLIPPRLIVIGGFSGTGKSTLAAHIAPYIGNAPGALHLRSDLERKFLFAIEETERLEAQFYSPATNIKVYDILLQKAAMALQAGHSVILDAVYSQTQEREAVEKLAQDLTVSFTGLWLTAPKEELITRVEKRVGDASDATPEVVGKQLQRDTGEIFWHMIQAGGSASDTANLAMKIL